MEENNENKNVETKGTENVQEKKKKSGIGLTIVLVILIIALAGGIGYLTKMFLDGKIENGANNNVTNESKIEGKKIDGMHYIVDQDSSVNSDAVKNAFAGRFFNFNISKSTMTKWGDYSATNGVFYFEELIGYSGLSTEKYKTRKFEMYQYDVTSDYVLMVPVDATVSGDKSETQKVLVVVDANGNEISSEIYVDDDGNMYVYENGTRKDLVYYEETKNVSDGKVYFTTSGGSALKYNNEEVWVEKGTLENDKNAAFSFAGRYYFAVTSHLNDNLYIEKYNSTYRLVVLSTGNGLFKEQIADDISTSAEYYNGTKKLTIDDTDKIITTLSEDELNKWTAGTEK